ncbi:MAG: DbpA RNA binding domain-containing protein, partial [Novosphingobium sp.]
APVPQGPRPGFEGSNWFRLNVGRNQNADPRWILPLLCRLGHVSRTDIGAIRIAAGETMFEIAAGVAPKFLDAVKRNVEPDSDVEITAFEGKPRDEPQRRDARPSGNRGPRPAGSYSPRPPHGNGPRPDKKFGHRKGPRQPR